MAEDKKPPTVPMGEPLDSSDEELDRLSIITPEDIELAKAAARRHGGKSGISRFLEAEPE